LDNIQLDLLYRDIPRLEAIRELRFRAINAQRSPPQLHDLILLATGNAELAMAVGENAQRQLLKDSK